MSEHPNPPAFPVTDQGVHGTYGMTLRDWFAGQALGNHALCTGRAELWELTAWFGDRGGITCSEIVAAQAATFADAMLAERLEALVADSPIVAELLEALENAQAFIGAMFGTGPSANIPAMVVSPIGAPIKLGELARGIDAALAKARQS